jgi:hypothetical protein
MSDSTEILLGELRGQMSSVQQALARIESRLEEGDKRMESLASDQLVLKTQAKLGWKMITAVGAAASVGGASVKHVLEKILG